MKRQVHSSSNFASFFIVMTHNSSVDFKLILFLLWIKGSHQSSNFETFKCSGENLPYSSCHFPTHKSAFLQILHHSLVSWKITPLYFSRPNIKYFPRQEQMKLRNFWDFWVLGSNFTKFLSFVKQQISFSSNFASLFSVMKDNPSVLFRLNIKYFPQQEQMKVRIFVTFECLGQISPNSCHFWNNRSVFPQFCINLQGHDTQLLCTFLAKILYTFNKSRLSRYKFGEILPEQSKVWNFVLWWASFVQIMYSLS